MIRIGKILFASDLTACSARALPLACDLAALAHAELHVVHVEAVGGADFGWPAATEDADGPLATRLRALVEEECSRDRWASRTSISIRTAVLHDVAPAPALLHYALAHDIDLIVMGTHGRRGLSRLVVGSVANEVVRRAACPVLTASGRTPYDGTLRSILVPVDFSVYAREALHHAKELAAFFGARIDLLHVIDVRVHPSFYNTGVFSIQDLMPDADRKARACLEHFCHETEGPVDAMHVEVVSGQAATEIVAYARSARSDLIVMSTHGLTGIEHLLIGSVTEHVVRMAPCPVLTVKAFGRSLVGTARDEVVEEFDLREG